MPRYKTSVILTDVHVPFHNQKLLDKVCQLMVDIRPHHLVLGGDFLDLYSLSKWHKNSLYHLKGMNLSYEYEQGNKVIDQLVAATRRGTELDYLYGNHEDNYLRWKQDGDNAKVGSELVSPEDAMRLREDGFRVWTNWKDDRVQIGQFLEVAHGEYISVHAAKKHLDENEGSVVFGHTHRWQSYVTGKWGAYNIGCLCDKDSEGFRYASRSQRQKWVSGFAIVHVLADGSFIPVPIQCWNDMFVYGGKVY